MSITTTHRRGTLFPKIGSYQDRKLWRSSERLTDLLKLDTALMKPLASPLQRAWRRCDGANRHVPSVSSHAKAKLYISIRVVRGRGRNRLLARGFLNQRLHLPLGRSVTSGQRFCSWQCDSECWNTRMGCVMDIYMRRTISARRST